MVLVDVVNSQHCSSWLIVDHRLIAATGLAQVSGAAQRCRPKQMFEIVNKAAAVRMFEAMFSSLFSSQRFETIQLRTRRNPQLKYDQNLTKWLYIPWISVNWVLRDGTIVKARNCRPSKLISHHSINHRFWWCPINHQKKASTINWVRQRW